MREGHELLARLRHIAWRLGPIGWVGVAAGALALALSCATLFEVEPANQAILQDVVRLKAQLAQAAVAGAQPHFLANPADPIAAVGEQLPSADQLPVFIQEVQSRASGAGIQIDRAEYRMQAALAGRGLRLQLVMPAHAAYPQLRGWLETLLHEHPSAALDELSLRRESDGAGRLEAHVTLSFYTRAIR